jgi:2'-5' RNA ligase
MFLALDPPASAREEIAAWRDSVLGERDELRPVATEALHVTLAFLAWQNEADAERIAGLAFDAAGTDSPLLTPTELRAVPPKRTRLFALSLEDDAAAAGLLQERAVKALADATVFRPEERPFWAHITLARVKRGVRSADAPEPTALPGAFRPEALTLYRSTLRPQGALYEPLARLPLAYG